MGLVLLNSWSVLQFIVLSFNMWKEVLGSLGVAKSLPIRGKLWTLSSFILTHAAIIVFLSRKVWHCLTSCLFLGGSKRSSDLSPLFHLCLSAVSSHFSCCSCGNCRAQSFSQCHPVWPTLSLKIWLFNVPLEQEKCWSFLHLFIWGGFSWLEFPGLVLLLLLKMSTAELFTC